MGGVGVARATGLLVAMAIASTSGAGEAQERRLKLGAGAGLMTLQTGAYVGPSIGAEGALTYGLSDQFNLLLEATASPHTLIAPAPDPCPEAPAPCEARRYRYPTLALTGGAGVVYTLDVTRVQPYAGVLVGGLRVGAGDTTLGALRGTRGALQRFDLVVALGVDVQVTPTWAMGVALRLHEAPPGGATTMSSLSVRAQFTWERPSFSARNGGGATP